MTTKALKGCGIYALVCPDTGEIKYVGQSRNMRRRYTQHCTPSDTKSARDLAVWLKDLREAGKKPKAIALEHIEDTDELDAAEKGWIDAISQHSQLLNMTQGGAGAVSGEGKGLSPAPKPPLDEDITDAINRAKAKAKPAKPRQAKTKTKTPITRVEADMSLTAKQDAFAFAYIETGNASEAYRRSYDVGENTKPETVWRKACEVMANGKVAARVHELRSQFASEQMVTLSSITDDLREAHTLSRDLDQPHNMIKATTEIAKLHGLTADKLEITGKDGGAIKTEDTTEGMKPEDLARKLAFLLSQGVDAMKKGGE